MPLPTVPVDFAQGANSGSTLSVGDTQIVITNQLSATFCQRWHERWIGLH